MRLVVLVTILIVGCSAISTKGVISKVYSKHGLENFYTEMFDAAPQTFVETIGEEEEYTGIWIFGKSMKVYDTKLTGFDMGEVREVGFNENQEYVYTTDQITGTFTYKWKFRWFVVPFTHRHSCKITIPGLKITSKYAIRGTDFINDVSVDVTNSPKYLTCDDTEQSKRWGYGWMTEVREEYEKNIPAYLSESIQNWFSRTD